MRFRRSATALPPHRPTAARSMRSRRLPPSGGTGGGDRPPDRERLGRLCHVVHADDLHAALDPREGRRQRAGEAAAGVLAAAEPADEALARDAQEERTTEP